jgi:molybdate transport system regulatory protein
MKIKFKIWIETDDGKPILGKGGVKLLENIKSKKGGKGAGGTMLSEKLDKIIEIYQSAEKEIEEVLKKYEEKLNDVTTNT